MTEVSSDGFLRYLGALGVVVTRIWSRQYQVWRLCIRDSLQVLSVDDYAEIGHRHDDMVAIIGERDPHEARPFSGECPNSANLRGKIS